MATGWLNDAGYTYYLSDSEVGASFYSSHYGIALVDLHEIGPYKYSFKNDAHYWAYPMSTYPHAALFKNCSYAAVFCDGVLFGYANIDSAGRVNFVQILEVGDEIESSGSTPRGDAASGESASIELPLVASSANASGDGIEADTRKNG